MVLLHAMNIPVPKIFVPKLIGIEIMQLCYAKNARHVRTKYSMAKVQLALLRNLIKHTLINAK